MMRRVLGLALCAAVTAGSAFAQTKPGGIVALGGSGPPETIAVLNAANIDFVTVPERFSPEGIATKVRVVGEAIGEPAKARVLANRIVTELAAVTAKSRDWTGEKRRVMFVLSTQGGRIMASGAETAPASMIAMAGAQNAVTAFEGYKPMTDEAVIAAAPDVILMMEREGTHDSTVDELVALPSIASTPAGRDRAVIRMDGLYLLGFGPRTAAAVTDLRAALYGG